MAKASTPTDEPAESSGDEQKETPEPIATSRSTDNPKVDPDKFRVVRVKGATDAFLVDVKMCTEGQLKTIPESSDRYSKRRSHRRGRGNNRKESLDAVDSGSSDDSSGTRSSRSSGRSSCSGRSSR